SALTEEKSTLKFHKMMVEEALEDVTTTEEEEIVETEAKEENASLIQEDHQAEVAFHLTDQIDHLQEEVLVRQEENLQEEAAHQEVLHLQEVVHQTVLQDVLQEDNIKTKIGKY